MLLSGEHSAADQLGRISGEDRWLCPRAYNVISEWMCKMWGACQLTESHGWTFSVWREQAQWLSLCRVVLCGPMESTLWWMPIAMENYLVDTGNAVLFSVFRAVSTAILLRGYFYMNIWHLNSFWGERWLYWEKNYLVNTWNGGSDVSVTFMWKNSSWLQMLYVRERDNSFGGDGEMKERKGRETEWGISKRAKGCVIFTFAGPPKISQQNLLYLLGTQ